MMEDGDAQAPDEIEEITAHNKWSSAFGAATKGAV
jgi:hypothetical protein